jgi:2-oxoglutarate ferredoxin oxidoreductase subunit beta
MSFDYSKYLRNNKLPHIWCPGCGYGIVLKALVRAVHALGWNKDDIVVASGIGCASRMPGYLDFNTLHTTHGRSLAFATGVKVAKPHLKVIALGGDGDMSAIGGNHLIHSCRRNIDISLLVLNNNIYGMTGGQSSPTTPLGGVSSTSPYGMVEHNFDISGLTIGAGASFVARTSSYHVAQMDDLMKKTLSHNGFSVLEIMSGCPTGFGRKNKQPDGVTALEWQKNNAVPIAKYNEMTRDEKAGKFSTGILHQEERPEYVDMYDKSVQGLR